MKACRIIKLCAFITVVVASVCAVCVYCDKRFRKTYITVSE